MCFMQSGAPSYFPIAIRSYLYETFPRQWISRSNFEWPPKSSDFNLLEYYFCRYIKSLVYVNSENEPLKQIQNAAKISKTKVFH